MEQLWKVLRSVFRVRSVRNDRHDTAIPARGPVGPGIMPFVRHRGARPDVRPDIERGLQLHAVTDLAAGKMAADRLPVAFRLEVDFGREAATEAVAVGDAKERMNQLWVEHVSVSIMI